MMKKTLLVFQLTTLLAIKTYAQITFTKDDLPGVSSFHLIDSEENPTINLPAAGENKTWDYSDIIESDTSLISLKEASSSPYYSQFQDATLVYEEVSDNSDGSVLFLKEGNQGLYLTGAFNPDLYFIAKYSQPSLLFAAPITYGATVSDSSKFITETDMNSIKVTYTHFSRQFFSAIGYGAITTPAGTFENSLLIKQTEYTYDTSSTSVTETTDIELDTTVTYAWVQKDKTLPIIMEIVTDYSGENIAYASYYVKENATGVDKTNLSFQKHFPVPANDFFTIQLKEEQSGVLTLFATGGQPVLKQSINSSNNITINTSKLLSGMYFYEISLDNGSKILNKISITH